MVEKEEDNPPGGERKEMRCKVEEKEKDNPPGGESKRRERVRERERKDVRRTIRQWREKKVMRFKGGERERREKKEEREVRERLRDEIPTCCIVHILFPYPTAHALIYYEGTLNYSTRTHRFVMVLC